ncbi:MAG TPA: hypothetical protein VFE23_10650 [Usitatibacter sp.]|jgi:hypothetical protein|nr:hypothetical protein [Usitatibacter sp.]
MKEQRKPETIYALDPSKLRVNDVVLTSDFGFKRSVIRAATNSDFSHAAICTRDYMLLEAVPDGISRISPIGVCAPKIEWICVLRPRNEAIIKQTALTIAEAAESLYGRRYSVIGAIGTVIPFLPRDDEGHFCSQLVALAFEKCGICLVPGKTAYEVTPGLLLTSPELSNVTQQCVRELDACDDAESYEHIREIGANESVHREMGMNRRVLRALQKELRGEIPEVNSLHEFWNWLGENRSNERVLALDQRIFSVLQSEGFVKWYDEWLDGMRADSALLDVLAGALGRIEEASDHRVPALRRDMADAVKSGDVALAGRKATVNATSSYSSSDSKTLRYLHQKYSDELAVQQELQDAKRKLFAALGRLADSSGG